MNVRLATNDDADAIWEFWESLDPTWRCSPGEPHPSRELLDKWLAVGSRRIMVVDGGRITCSAVYNESTAQIDWLHFVRDTANDFIPLCVGAVSERCGKNAWGMMGVASTAQVVASVPGMTEDDFGVTRWVGT